MASRLPRPSIETLKKILAATNLRVVERATMESERKDGTLRRVTVRGTYDPATSTITVGKRLHSKWGSDDVVATVIHELLHRALPHASEQWVYRHEMEYFKNVELREAVAVRLLNVIFYGEVQK